MMRGLQIALAALLFLMGGSGATIAYVEFHRVQTLDAAAKERQATADEVKRNSVKLDRIIGDIEGQP